MLATYGSLIYKFNALFDVVERGVHVTPQFATWQLGGWSVRLIVTPWAVGAVRWPLNGAGIGQQAIHELATSRVGFRTAEPDFHTALPAQTVSFCPP